jgi:hypothetical protein
MPARDVRPVFPLAEYRNSGDTDMSHASILKLLIELEKRLVVITSKATQTAAHAQHTLEHLHQLANDVTQLRARLLSTVDTGGHPPLGDTQELSE